MFENIKVINPLKLKSNVKPLKDTILVKNIERGIKKLSSGILIPDDNVKEHGIRPRWGQVYAVGENIKDIKPGQYILIEHARWSRGIAVNIDGEEFYLHKVENNSILAISDEEPNEFKLMTNLY